MFTMLHTNELPLRHLIAKVDGPTCSDNGFTGPVCSLLSHVNEIAYDPDFRVIPGSERIIYIPEKVVNSMSTDRRCATSWCQLWKRDTFPTQCRRCTAAPSVMLGG